MKTRARIEITADRISVNSLLEVINNWMKEQLESGRPVDTWSVYVAGG